MHRCPNCFDDCDCVQVESGSGEDCAHECPEDDEIFDDTDDDEGDAE